MVYALDKTKLLSGPVIGQFCLLNVSNLGIIYDIKAAFRVLPQASLH